MKPPLVALLVMRLQKVLLQQILIERRSFTCLQVSESKEMRRRMRAWKESAEGAQWQAKREQLPVVQIRQGLLEALSQHDVTVVGGDTGCGKTTQVTLRTCVQILCPSGCSWWSLIDSHIRAFDFVV